MTVQGGGQLPGSETNAGAGGGSGSGTAAQSSLTPEQVNTLLNAAETQDQIVAALNNLATHVQKGQAPAAKASTPAKSDTDDVSELLADPKRVIAQTAQKVLDDTLNNKLGPHLLATANAAARANLETEADRVDSEYGEGFFDANVKTLLLGKDGKSGALGVMSLSERAVPDNVQAATSGVLGELLRSNPKLIMDAMTKQATARAARERTLNPPRTLGPGLPRGTKADSIEIPDNVSRSLERLNELGFKFTKDDLVASLSRGRSLDDWDDYKPAYERERKAS